MSGSPWEHRGVVEVTWPRAIGFSLTLPAVCAAILFGFLCLCSLGCDSTSYKVSRATTKIATARRNIEHAKERTAELETVTKRTQSSATTTAEHIEAAIAANTAKDNVTVAQELIAAKASNALVMLMLEQSYRNIVSLQTSFNQTDSDLVAAEEEVKAMAIQGAKDRAIVEEVNWGFLGVHIGALFYFFKSVLRLGFWGIVVFIVLGLVLAGLAAFVGGPFKVAFGWFWSLLRRKKTQ